MFFDKTMHTSLLLPHPRAVASIDADVVIFQWLSIPRGSCRLTHGTVPWKKEALEEWGDLCVVLRHIRLKVLDAYCFLRSASTMTLEPKWLREKTTIMTQLNPYSPKHMKYLLGS